MFLALHSLLAMMLACAAALLVNLAGGALADLAGFPGGGGRLGWDLGWFFVAGVLATWLLVRLAPRAPRWHAAAFLMLALVACGLGLARLGSDWPVWFSAGVALSLPVQVWLGARWGLRGRR